MVGASVMNRTAGARNGVVDQNDLLSQGLTNLYDPSCNLVWSILTRLVKEKCNTCSSVLLMDSLPARDRDCLSAGDSMNRRLKEI